MFAILAEPVVWIAGLAGTAWGLYKGAGAATPAVTQSSGPSTAQILVYGGAAVLGYVLIKKLAK